MVPPTSQKEVRKFIDVINYYHNMWPRRSHTLAPLIKKMSIKIYFKWTQVELDTFDEIKRIMDCDTLSTYPYLNETFMIHTDASAFQLGGL